MKFEIFGNVWQEPGTYRTATQWYWHLRASNGQIIACAKEGFSSKQGALRAVRTVARRLRNSQHVDVVCEFSKFTA